MRCANCGFWLADPTPRLCTRCGQPTSEPDRTGPAWEKRQSGLDLQAMLETVKGVLFRPSATFRGMRREGGLGSPYLYVILLGTVGGWFALLWNSFFQSLGVLGEGLGEEEIFGYVALVMIGVLMPLFVTIGVFIGSGITHLCLLFVGGARQGFETTFRVSSYVNGSTSLFQIVPLCGGIVGFIWYIVGMIIGLRETHEISTGRAALAVLLPIIVCCGCGLILLFTFFGAAISALIQKA